MSLGQTEEERCSKLSKYRKHTRRSSSRMDELKKKAKSHASVEYQVFTGATDQCVFKGLECLECVEKCIEQGR